MSTPLRGYGDIFEALCFVPNVPSEAVFPITRDGSRLPFLGAPTEVRDAPSEIIICIFVSFIRC